MPLQCKSVQGTRKPRLWRVAKASAIVVAIVAAAPYAWGPVYRFPEPTRFTGTRLWNPYQDLNGTWQRANLHAHGRAWSGLTNGQQSDANVVQRYRDLGYDVPGVSDYQHIAAQHGIATMPIYEHGYNVIKRHQLAIGAHSVQWFDFLLWQSLSHQQYVIDRVKATADLVALAHPSTRDAYTPADVQHLTTYDLIEVVNGPFTAEAVWDAALSSGHPVWAVANDDTHDVNDPRRTAAAWNMVAAASSSTADVVNSLKAGRSYAVLRTGAVTSANQTVLSRVDVAEHTLTVSVAGAQSTFTFIGQDGAVRKAVTNATEASYTLTSDDTYVRTVITAPEAVLFVNPVLRHDGDRLVARAAIVDLSLTWVVRGGSALLVAVGLVLLAYARHERGHPPVPVRAAVANVKQRHIA